MTLPGYYNGRHFTTYVSDVNNLKKSGKVEEAERLLLELVKATEETPMRLRAHHRIMKIEVLDTVRGELVEP